MKRIAAALVMLLVVAACGSSISGESDLPSASPTESPMESPIESQGQCANWTLPPDVGPSLVPGITVRAVDKGHFEITNATSRTYYYRVSAWFTDLLDCGLGVTESEYMRGPIKAGETIEVGEGSTKLVSVTVGIWDHPCGEACSSPPIGWIFVPMSSVEPVPEYS